MMTFDRRSNSRSRGSHLRRLPCQDVSVREVRWPRGARSGLWSSSLAACKTRPWSSSRTSGAAPPSGSTPCAETWNSSAMTAFRSRLRQAIAERPMNAHAFSSSPAGTVPTPMAADARKGPGGKRNSPTLRAVLPTLTTKSSHRQQNATGERVSLQQRVHLLPTPTATSYGTNRGGGAGRVGKVRPSLRSLVPTLTVRDNPPGQSEGGRWP